MEVIPRPVKGLGLGSLAGAKRLFQREGKGSGPKGGGGSLVIRQLSSHLPLPADSFQLASDAHAVSQADETLSKALVYGVTAPWACCSCCQRRYKD